MTNILYIKRPGEERTHQYLFDAYNPAEWAELQRLMLKGIEQGWHMEYIPARAREDQG